MHKSDAFSADMLVDQVPSVLNFVRACKRIAVSRGEDPNNIEAVTKQGMALYSFMTTKPLEWFPEDAHAENFKNLREMLDYDEEDIRKKIREAKALREEVLAQAAQMQDAVAAIDLEGLRRKLSEAQRIHQQVVETVSATKNEYTALKKVIDSTRELSTGTASELDVIAARVSASAEHIMAQYDKVVDTVANGIRQRISPQQPPVQSQPREQQPQRPPSQAQPPPPIPPQRNTTVGPVLTPPPRPQEMFVNTPGVVPNVWQGPAHGTAPAPSSPLPQPLSPLPVERQETYDGFSDPPLTVVDEDSEYGRHRIEQYMYHTDFSDPVLPAPPVDTATIERHHHMLDSLDESDDFGEDNTNFEWQLMMDRANRGERGVDILTGEVVTVPTSAGNAIHRDTDETQVGSTEAISDDGPLNSDRIYGVAAPTFDDGTAIPRRTSEEEQDNFLSSLEEGMNRLTSELNNALDEVSGASAPPPPPPPPSPPTRIRVVEIDVEDNDESIPFVRRPAAGVRIVPPPRLRNRGPRH